MTMSTKAAEPMLTPKDLAERWNIPRRRLDAWRYEGRGPAYLKIGGLIRYRVDDVEAFEADNLVTTGGAR